MNRTVFLIVGRSLRRHALSSFVTVLSAALASGLVMAVFSIAQQSNRAFGAGGVGFDAVLGARGSATQLVLNTVYHLETSPGNVPWSMVERMQADPRVRLAIPYALGDSLRGYRIVGTTADLFTRFEPGPGESYEIRSPGRVFDPERREAVLGAAVAEALGLGLNDTFLPTHGIAEHGAHIHEEEYSVVGVLAPTSSPVDRVIWIPIEGIYHMSGHYGRNAEGEELPASPQKGIPQEFREVSAVMLQLAGGQAGFSLSNEINRGETEATLVWPIATTMAQLLQKLGWVNRILEWVAVLVVVVAAGSLLASLYNTMNERREEFAVLRALGARRRLVFSVILLEAASLAAAGAVLGYLVYFGILSVSASIVREQTGVSLDSALLHPALFWTPPMMIVVGLIAGAIPARNAYATDVAGSLSRS